MSTERRGRRTGEDLEANLKDLSKRLARGTYRAKPVKRAYVPKEGGKQRPTGIPVLEDKIVQRSAVQVLNAIYETDFLGFSYGYRPGRSAHMALDALAVGIQTKKVSWLLDADIRGFFDTLDHEWLVKFIEHRIADHRVVRHIQKWMNAGVMEEGKRIQQEQGVPQGGSISPLLANVYLHYVFDLWADQWRKTQAHGEIIIVRYADDFVVGFQHESDARRFLEDLRERFRKFNLELHAGGEQRGSSANASSSTSTAFCCRIPSLCSVISLAQGVSRKNAQGPMANKGQGGRHEGNDAAEAATLSVL